MRARLVASTRALRSTNAKIITTPEQSISRVAVSLQHQPLGASIGRSPHSWTRATRASRAHIQQALHFFLFALFLHMPDGVTPAERHARAGVRARRWSSRKRKRAAAAAVEFRLVSYNLLARQYTTQLGRALYRVGAHRLEWSSRAKTLRCELEMLSGDVVCAQEYEEKAWRGNEALLGDEYARAALCERSGEARGEKRAEKREGCAIFIRRGAFTCETTEKLKFDDYGLGDNAACVVTLRHRARDGFRLVVANAHLLFNPKRGDAKVGQVRVLLATVARIRQDIVDRGLMAHCVICGDFNFSPNSALYHFFSNGRLDLSEVNRRELSGTLVDVLDDRNVGDDQVTRIGRSETEDTAIRAFNQGWGASQLALALGDRSTPFPSRTGVELESASQSATQKRGTDVEQVKNLMRLTPGGFTVHHAFEAELSSAYVAVAGGEPAFTTCHNKFCGTNDYIWYTSNLEPTRVLQSPSLDDVLRYGKLPSVRYASDHVSIGADFRIG